jgi:hypothetical protein
MEDECRIHRAIAEDDTPEEDDLEEDMENIDLDKPSPSRARVQIDHLVSQAQQNQTVKAPTKAPPVNFA